VQALCRLLPSLSGLRVLDAGCGEGKNAEFLSNLGALVEAFDLDDAALLNRQGAWLHSRVKYWQADILTVDLLPGSYDIVIAYGLLHCLPTPHEITSAIYRLKTWVRPGGYLVICSFNARYQDLRAHPGFQPCLLSHDSYLSYFQDCELIIATDLDLQETHPHNAIPHVHSLSRLLVRRPSEADAQI
jgi:2-polyprenyl-3-methyl-5-hydroxy-6-metoxy-1,4-benzoquinol methylase